MESADEVREFNAVRAALEANGISAHDFGRFTSDRHPDVIRPSVFDHAAAVPVLLEWLPKVQTARVKEVIVRSLTSRSARPQAARPLIAEFKKASDDSLKWAIGNALDAVADNAVEDDLIALARDPAHGRGRQMIVYRLGRGRKSSSVAQLMVSLMTDDDVALHAMTGVQRQLGREKALPLIEGLLSHDSQAVRQAAQRQVRKIASAQRNASKTS